MKSVEQTSTPKNQQVSFADCFFIIADGIEAYSLGAAYNSNISPSISALLRSVDLSFRNYNFEL